MADRYAQLAPRVYEYVLAGILLAGMAGAVLGYHVYHGFITEDIARDRAYWGIGLAFVGVAAGIYLFAYGWQRGDVKKAVRMMMWLTLGPAGVIVALLAALSLRRSSGFGLFGFGRGSYRRRRSGWLFGSADDRDYHDAEPLLGATVLGDAPERYEPGPDVLTTHCRHCGAIFVPQPPRAACPACGHSALEKAR